MNSGENELENQTRLDPQSESDIRRQVGPYKILQKIADGGMGSVFMAEQKHPVRRRVALKLIKAGKYSHGIIVRFEAERQALAMMNHPNIAKVLDVGSAEDGSPYFAMELVKGIPLTKYCDSNKLSVRERLQLFVPICYAIQHAHHKAIVHRDLKPSNVLVAIYDGVAVPKVIDFGLAKAIDQQSTLTDKTMFTEFGAIVGTIQYMSPEQAELNQLDVDARTDIYSLGVMLYELLTGSTPLDMAALKQSTNLKILEMIREKDPPRPSNRLSEQSITIEDVSGLRKIQPAKLQQMLRGELDWIVMKALEKNRTRRYETATAFADDIVRFLNNEAVLARPQSTRYRLRKFAGKNKGLVAATLAIAALLLAGVMGTGYGLIRATQQTQVADQRTAEAVQLRNRANEEAARAGVAERDARKNEKVARDQSELALSTLGSVIFEIQDRLENVTGASEVRRQLLKTSLEKLSQIDQSFVTQSSVDRNTAAAFNRMGDLVLRFGADETISTSSQQKTAVGTAQVYYEQSLEIHRQLLESTPDDVQIKQGLANSFANLGKVLQISGNLTEALKQLENGFRIREQLAKSMPNDSEAQGLLAQSHYEIGTMLWQAGDVDEALKQYQHSFAIRKELADADPGNIQAQRDLSFSFGITGDILLDIGEVSKAQKQYEQSLKIRKSLSDADPGNVQAQRDLSISHFNTGDIFKQAGKFDDAMKQYEKSIQIRKRLVQSDPNDAQAQRNLCIAYDKLGAVLLETGRNADAKTQYMEILEIVEKRANADLENAEAQDDLAYTCLKCGEVLLQVGKLKEAEDQILRGLKIRSRLAEKAPDDSRAQRDLSLACEQYGRLLLRERKSVQAILQFLKTLKIRELRAEVDPTNLRAENDLSVSLADLGDAQLQAGQLKEAMASYRSCMKIVFRLTTVDIANAERRRELSRCYLRIGQVFVAFGEYKKAAESFKKGARILDEMIASDEMAETVKPDLEVANWKIKSANMMSVALGEWNALLEQPTESLAGLLETRAIELSRLYRSRFDAAAASAEKLITLENASGRNFYLAARTFCRCAASIKPGTSSDLDAKQKKWIASAVASLRKSYAAGPWDHKNFAENPDFDLIRDLPELQQLFTDSSKQHASN